MALTVIPLGLVFVIYAEDRPLMGWAAGVVSMIVLFIGHAVVFWKMERD